MDETTLNLRFENHQIRMVREGNEWLWHRGDVSIVLGYENAADASSKHLKDKDLRVIAFRDTTGRQQKQAFITEAGLYRLIMRSRNHEAEKFQDWVCEEVLPTLRKTGKYIFGQPHELLEHLDERVQKTLSKDANSHFFTNGGREALIRYNANATRDLSDKRLWPKEWKALAKAEGIPSKDRTSGLQALRHYEPHSAAAVSFDKEWILRGYDEALVRPHSFKAKELFRGMIADGMRPAEIDREVDETAV